MAANYQLTIISQYANSPRLSDLLGRIADGTDQAVNLASFQSHIWNVNTAQSYGLDVWGRIVGTGRFLLLTSIPSSFGFSTSPESFQPFDQAPFYNGVPLTQNYRMSDDVYRTVILAKAAVNISGSSFPEISAALQRIFGEYGRSYALQGTLPMHIRYVFEFNLSDVQVALLKRADSTCRPTGVKIEYLATDPGSTFGFFGSDLQPFNQGTLFSGDLTL